MKQVGMRELNQHPSRVIDLVKHGEAVEITDRGRPVARVVPITHHADALGNLVRDGRALAPATGAERIIPLPPAYGDPGESAAEEVAAARERERW
ncbi:MAG: type II toxin-antitoxin system prevent-host-death family antitoxin [Candidatus Dormibacter sp.]